MTAPDRIWAEPFYSVNPDGRFWDDDEWHVSLEPDGTALEWVRGDLYAALLAEKERLERERDALKRTDEIRLATLEHMGSAVKAMEDAIDRAEAAEADAAAARKRVRGLTEAWQVQNDRAALATEFFLASEERVQAYMDGTNEARISQSQVRFRAAREAMLAALADAPREGETRNG
jgi:hypothetical protein